MEMSLTYEPSSEKEETTSDLDKEQENDAPRAPLTKECIEGDENDVTTRPKRGRKRKREFTIKENNERRHSGLSHLIISKGKTVTKKSARTLQDPCTCKRFKCWQVFSKEKRQEIFSNYWGYGCLEKQWQYIANSVSSQAKNRTRTTSESSRRTDTRNYYLTNDQGVLVEVCKTFYLNTLSVSERSVTTALKKMENGIVEKDLRGKKESEENSGRKAKAKQHILSLLRLPSHYCRASSNLLCLPADLNKMKMYDLYKLQCRKEQETHLSYSTYQTLFQQMNLSFHLPKKDRCDICERHRNLDPAEQETNKEEYDIHRARAEKVQELKNSLKTLEVEQQITAIFNLQKALKTPKSEMSIFYYSRKLSTYNFTVTDVTNNENYCFVWDETIARRGLAEIGSSLLMLLRQWDELEKVTINFFSDSCVGQNRNWNVAGLFSWFLNSEAKSIKEINHYFFESGHSQSENDNVHAVIENASKNVEIFTPEQWYTIIRSAPKKKKYKVVELDQTMIFDIAKLSQDTINKKEQVKISKSQVMKFTTDGILASESILMKPREHGVRVMKKTKKIVLEQLYHGRIGISKAKKKDLVTLCQKLAIPKNYHNFYEQLVVDVQAVETMD